MSFSGLNEILEFKSSPELAIYMVLLDAFERQFV
jgi:hypothetical protein